MRQGSGGAAGAPSRARTSSSNWLGSRSPRMRSRTYSMNCRCALRPASSSSGTGVFCSWSGLKLPGLEMAAAHLTATRSLHRTRINSRTPDKSIKKPIDLIQTMQHPCFLSILQPMTLIDYLGNSAAAQRDRSPCAGVQTSRPPSLHTCWAWVLCQGFTAALLCIPSKGSPEGHPRSWWLTGEGACLSERCWCRRKKMKKLSLP